MKGLGFSEHGGPERVGWVDLPEPVPGPGEIAVDVRAAAFNHLDRFVLEGMPGVPIARPHVLGSDGAGTVAALGEGVLGPAAGAEVLLNPGLWDGTCPACVRGEESLCRAYRILGEHVQGSMTTRVVLPARNIFPKPERLSMTEAASAPLVFQTAWRALLGVGALRVGERVAIIGAGGGVATAAIQIARLRGGEVTAVSRSPEKLEKAARLGAATLVTVPPDGSIDRALWAASGKEGYDLILDSVGRESVPRTLRALARGGRLVLIGATTGALAEIDLRTLFWRQASLRGSTMAGRGEFEAMLGELASGTIRPVIDHVYPSEEAPEAFARLFAPDLFGKVVVRWP